MRHRLPCDHATTVQYVTLKVAMSTEILPVNLWLALKGSRHSVEEDSFMVTHASRFQNELIHISSVVMIFKNDVPTEYYHSIHYVCFIL